MFKNNTSIGDAKIKPLYYFLYILTLAKCFNIKDYSCKSIFSHSCVASFTLINVGELGLEYLSFWFDEKYTKELPISLTHIYIFNSNYLNVVHLDVWRLQQELSRPVSHGEPEAPCVGPKYYTQTVAITSKPEIPHSTFLIPAARLLSWAPHEEPLLEREGSCISLAPCLPVCLYICSPSLPRFVSPPIYLSLSYFSSVTLRRFIFTSLPYSFSPALCFVAHSLSPPSCVCLFISFHTSLRFLSVPPLCRTLFSFSLSLSPDPAVCLSISLSLCVSRYSCRDFLTC